MQTGQKQEAFYQTFETNPIFKHVFSLYAACMVSQKEKNKKKKVLPKMKLVCFYI